MTALVMWTVEIRDTDDGDWRPMTTDGEPGGTHVYSWKVRDEAAETAASFEHARVVPWHRQEGA